MRTKLSTCGRKRRYPDAAAACTAAVRSDLVLRAYRCDRCGHYHLTGRIKGKWVPRPN